MDVNERVEGSKGDVIYFFFIGELYVSERF